MSPTGKPEARASGKKERIGKMLLDLTSIEVTTLVTEKITGESMGDPQQAVTRLRSLYASKLGGIADTYGGQGDASKGVLRTPAQKAAASEPMTFKAQGRMADKLVEQHSDLAADDLGHLARIRAHSDHLEGLSAKLGVGEAPAQSYSSAAAPSAATPSAGEPRLSPTEMVKLRKMWELGIEPIAMQTVIQMGGDMITRIHPDVVGGAHPLLLDLHRTGIETATGIWRTLVDTAVLILEKILDR